MAAKGVWIVVGSHWINVANVVYCHVIGDPSAKDVTALAIEIYFETPRKADPLTLTLKGEEASLFLRLLEDA